MLILRQRELVALDLRPLGQILFLLGASPIPFDCTPDGGVRQRKVGEGRSHPPKVLVVRSVRMLQILPAVCNCRGRPCATSTLFINRVGHFMCTSNRPQKQSGGGGSGNPSLGNVALFGWMASERFEQIEAT